MGSQTHPAAHNHTHTEGSTASIQQKYTDTAYPASAGPALESGYSLPGQEFAHYLYGTPSALATQTGNGVQQRKTLLAYQKQHTFKSCTKRHIWDAEDTFRCVNNDH